MARKKASQNLGTDAETQADPGLRAHLAWLGLGSVSDYRRWCRQNGFGQGLHKDYRQRAKERESVARRVAEARIADRRRESRHPEATIERIFGGEPVAGSPTAPAVRLK